MDGLLNSPDHVPPHLTHDDPLVACLVEISKLHGNPVSAQALTSGLPLVDDKLTLSLLPRAAARAHCSARLLRRKLDDLPAAVLPAILIMKDGRACVLLGRSKSGFQVLFPETGSSAVEVDRKELLQQYSGLAYFIKPCSDSKAVLVKTKKIEPAIGSGVPFSITGACTGTPWWRPC